MYIYDTRKYNGLGCVKFISIVNKIILLIKFRTHKKNHLRLDLSKPFKLN